MNNSLCIILARGGSKRIPRKNIRNFCGKPMLAWPIEAALCSNLFDDVIVSTDDQEIAREAKCAGASVPFMRPQHLADDFSSTADVLSNTLDMLKKNNNALPTYCCCLYGTSAMITPILLQDGLEKIQNAGVDCVYSVTEYSHPIERALHFNNREIIQYRYPEFTNIRTQDIKPSFYDLGLFYWLSIDAFIKKGGKSFLPLTKSAIKVSRFGAVDIDTEEDWNFAEKLAQIHGLDNKT